MSAGVSFTGQGLWFLQTATIGFFTGLLYDAFRIVRKIFPHPNVITQLEDLLFWILATLAAAFFLLNQNNGELRVFFIVGIFLGVVLYFAALSRFVMSVSTALINFVKKPVRKLLQFIKKYVRIGSSNLKRGAVGLTAKTKEKVKVKKKSSAKAKFFFALWIAIAVGFGAANLSRLSNYEQLRQTQAGLTQQIDAATRQQNQLQKELASYNSDAYIEKIARDKLGLVLPDEYVIYADGQ